MDYTVLLISVFSVFGLTPCSHTILREYHRVSLKMNWTEAQHYCRVKHTDLATIESMDDISRLDRPNLPSYFWIGLSDDPKSWKGVMGNDTVSWRWSATGETSRTSYHNWQPGQPNNIGSVQICVVMDIDGTWKDESCHQTIEFVCYNATNPPCQKTYTVIDIKMKWEDARAYCRTHHTDLAMIENAQENTEVLVTSARVVWIGLYRVPWRWSDNTSVSFTNWLYGQPNNVGGEYCAAEKSVDHLWHDVKCDFKLPFICHAALKKRTVVRMKIQTKADLSDPATNAKILQQLGAVLANETLLTDVRLEWKIRPRQQQDKQTKRDGENDEANGKDGLCN